MAQTTEFMDYISKKEQVYLERSVNFVGKADNYTVPLGWKEEKVTAVKAKLMEYKEACANKNALHLEAQSATKHCNALQKDCTALVRELKKEAELSPNCTPAILEDLGMNNTKKIIEMDTAFPDLKVKLVAGVPQIRYKKTPFDGIRLHCSINNGEFSYEETVTQCFYNDTKARKNPAQPELREYTAYFIKKGQIVGQMSKKVKIVLEAL